MIPADVGVAVVVVVVSKGAGHLEWDDLCLIDFSLFHQLQQCQMKKRTEQVRFSTSKNVECSELFVAFTRTTTAAAAASPERKVGVPLADRDLQ